jgi:RHS repeat-associated protein
MSALAQTTESDCYTRAANEDSIDGGLRTRTKYIYNALGQLTEKSGSGGTTLLMYDEAGHLLGEYTSAGALIQETVWMGDTPVATLRPNGRSISVYYVHTDQLNSPRVITRPSDNSIAWRWDTDPFGTSQPNQNPAGLGTFTYNLRFPGQYYQAETGLMYNYYRDYDPRTGRYLEPDPLGLGGGINPYSYTGNNPISNVDPSGLFSIGPAALEAALKRAGLAELAGGGPEDPLADLAAAVAIIGTVVLADPPAASPTPSSAGSSCPPQDPCKGLRDQLRQHEQKLSSYLQNPLLNDNTGILGAATLLGNTERAQSIYVGRLRELSKQIANFKRLLAECEAKNGKR